MSVCTVYIQYADTFIRSVLILNDPVFVRNSAIFVLIRSNVIIGIFGIINLTVIWTAMMASSVQQFRNSYLG